MAATRKKAKSDELPDESGGPPAALQLSTGSAASALARLGVTEEEWRRRAASATKLLQSWAEEDSDEQRETFAKLSRAIDETRSELGMRKLYS